MICKNCKTENEPLKKVCSNCNSILEGLTFNNVTGKKGYRDKYGNFSEEINKIGLCQIFKDGKWIEIARIDENTPFPSLKEMLEYKPKLKGLL